MKKHLPGLVYLLGLIPLGLAHGFLRERLDGWLFLVAAIAYLLLLRLIGHLAVLFIGLREKRQIAEFNLAVENRAQQKRPRKT